MYICRNYLCTPLLRATQNGILSSYDALSVHPYRDSAPETALNEYENIRSIIQVCNLVFRDACRRERLCIQNVFGVAHVMIFVAMMSLTPCPDVAP